MLHLKTVGMHWDLKMTDRKAPEETKLEALFAQARHTPVPPELMTRVLADAEVLQPVRHAKLSWSQRLATGLQGRFAGWSVMGGMAAASCVGFWIGVNPPAALDALSLPLTGVVLGEAAEVSGFGWDLEEADI